MKNSILIALVLGLVLFLDSARAQQNFSEKSSVYFNRSDVVLTFNLKTTLPDGRPYQAIGRSYITGNGEGQDEHRVHRIVVDHSIGVYFGYDLIIKPSGTLGKYLVSVHPLSRTLSELTLLNSSEYDSKVKQLARKFKANQLPKYPNDMTVGDGDTIALDILYNPQTKTKIIDFIKVTTEKPQDFTPSAVRLRLTSPKLFLNGTASSLPGNHWEGSIEGSIVHVYIPGKGRFIFSLFPQDGFNFEKNAVIKDNRIVFRLNDDRYEIVSVAPIVSSGGSWNLWTLYDADYRPDLIFSVHAAGYIEYGASNEVKNLLNQEWRKSRPHPVRPPKELIYQEWLI